MAAIAAGLDNPGLTDAQLLDATLAHPILINRPIVETPKGCVSAARLKLFSICWTSGRALRQGRRRGRDV
jgi:hypothetical protein